MTIEVNIQIYLMRDIRCISPSSLTARRETPFGEMSAVVYVNLDSTGNVSDLNK